MCACAVKSTIDKYSYYQVQELTQNIVKIIIQKDDFFFKRKDSEIWHPIYQNYASQDYNRNYLHSQITGYTPVTKPEKACVK